MEAFENLVTRRSVRKYKSDKISEEIINKILKAAMYSPSAMNLQAWHFIVIDKKEVLNETLASIPYAEFLKEAVAAILICGDSKIENNESWMIQNCSAVTQNVLLAANSLGVGSCWIGIHGMQEIVDNVSKQFKLPGNVVPVSLVSLGYPDEKVEAEERFNKGKIHYNKW